MHMKSAELMDKSQKKKGIEEQQDQVCRAPVVAIHSP